MRISEIEILAAMLADAVRSIELWKAMVLTADPGESGALHWLSRAVSMRFRNHAIEGMFPFSYEDIGCEAHELREKFVAVVDFFLKAMPTEGSDALFHGSPAARWCDVDRPDQWQRLSSAPHVLVLAAKTGSFSLETCLIRNNAAVLKMGNVEYAVRLIYSSTEETFAWRRGMQMYWRVSATQKMYTPCPQLYTCHEILEKGAEALVLERVGQTATTALPYYASCVKSLPDSIHPQSCLAVNFFSDQGLRTIESHQRIHEDRPATGYSLHVRLRCHADVRDVCGLIDGLPSENCMHLHVNLALISRATIKVYLDTVEKLLKRFTGIIGFSIMADRDYRSRATGPCHPALGLLRDLEHLRYVTLWETGGLLYKSPLALGKAVEQLHINNAGMANEASSLSNMVAGSGLVRLVLKKVLLEETADIVRALNAVSQTVTSLEINHVEFVSRKEVSVQGGLTRCTGLTHLTLKNIECSNAMWLDMPSAIYGMKHLKTLHVIPRTSKPFPQHRILNWYNAGHKLQDIKLACTPDMFSYAVTAVKYANQQLKSISLTSNWDAGPMPGAQLTFFQNLAACSNLLTLELIDFNLKHGAVLADSVRQMPLLENLFLENVSLNDPHLLCKSLRDLQNLQVLELHNVPTVAGECMTALFSDVRSMPSLIKLAISACKVPEASINTLINWIKKHDRKLIHLSLIGNYYGGTTAVEIASVAGTLPFLQTLMVGGVRMDAASVRKIATMAPSFVNAPYCHLRIGYNEKKIAADGVQVTSEMPTRNNCVIPVSDHPMDYNTAKGMRRDLAINPYLSDRHAPPSLGHNLVFGAPQVLVARTPALLQLPAMPYQRKEILGRLEQSGVWVPVGFYSSNAHAKGRVWVDTAPLLKDATEPMSCVFRVNFKGSKCSDPVLIHPNFQKDTFQSMHHDALESVGARKALLAQDGAIDKLEGELQNLTSKELQTLNKIRQTHAQIATTKSTLDNLNHALEALTDSPFMRNIVSRIDLEDSIEEQKQAMVPRAGGMGSTESTQWVELEAVVRYSSVSAITDEDVRRLLSLVHVHDLPPECKITGQALQTLTALAPECQAKLCGELGLPSYFMRARATLPRLGARLQELSQGSVSDLWNALQLVQEDGAAAPSMPPVKRQRVQQEQLECPITLEPLKDPVTASDGHTYSREGIETWLKTKKESPTTRRPIDSQTLVSNVQVQACLKRAREEQ